MDGANIDDIDRGILHLLQQNARDNTNTDIAAAVGVTATTVNNRIDRLKDEGVIRGYYPDIDYERAGFPLHVLFVCTATPSERARLAVEALDLHGVVDVRELLAGQKNLHVDVVARTTDEIEQVTQKLADLPLSIVNSDIVKTSSRQPWDHFYVVDGAGEDHEEDS